MGRRCKARLGKINYEEQGISLTFNPLALLIALKGRSTLSTLRILTTENCEFLK